MTGVATGALSRSIASAVHTLSHWVRGAHDPHTDALFGSEKKHEDTTKKQLKQLRFTSAHSLSLYAIV